MAFLRRGTVRRPHRMEAHLELHRVGMTPIRVYLKDISCFEEHRINASNVLTFIWFVTGSMISVTEDFETVDAMVNGEAVAP